MGAQPFVIDVPQEVLDDLRDRLERTRWPDEVEGVGWDCGANLGYMRELVDYWHTRFDWRAREREMNAVHHYRAEVGGLGIHCIHERGRGPRPLPLLITHGWPSSFLEMLKIIPLLTDPAAHGGDPRDAFDVIVPSLPGCGFSDRPRQHGTSKRRIAALWAQLMTELGYRRFAAHGGDIGSGVTAALGLDFPERLLGIHVTAVRQPYLGLGARELSEAERRYVELVRQWEDEEGGYGHIQSTRPQTLAYGLNDSPAALAAWIVEKFRAWSDCGGDVERRFSKDELLANVTLYWVTQTIHASTRLYYDDRKEPLALGPHDRIRVPTGVALTREEVDRAPREWAERSYDVQHWTELPRGGHFAAAEEPELLAADLRTFFRRLR